MLAIISLSTLLYLYVNGENRQIGAAVTDRLWL
jgi:hypothetical protein